MLYSSQAYNAESVKEKGQIIIHTAKSLYSRVPEKVGSISCEIVTKHLYKVNKAHINWLGSYDRIIHTWYRSNEFMMATGSPLHSWQMPALRRIPLTLYLRRLLLIDWRAIASNISVAFGYLKVLKFA
jgi:hypothetical protein